MPPKTLWAFFRETFHRRPQYLTETAVCDFCRIYGDCSTRRLYLALPEPLLLPPFSLPFIVGNGLSSLDTHLSSVATRLQAVSASINAGLEKSMVEIMVSVPRVVTEVERVEAAIKTLNGELINLSDQVQTSPALCQGARFWFR